MNGDPICRRRLTAFAAFLICVAFARMGAAFSVPNHALMTTAAVNQIRACIDNHPGRWDDLRALDAYSDVFLGCNMKQDDLERKVKLWHFYGDGRTVKGKFLEGDFLTADTSFDRYFEELTKRFNAEVIPPDQAYAATGAILHYVQDVAVPAHAVPIFHPNPLSNGDNFDGFPFQYEDRATDLTTCERLLGTKSDTFAGLPRETAQGTLAAIRTPISLATPPAPDGTWEQFWGAPDEKRGFGQYGCAGDRFGKTEVRCKGKKETVTKDTYARFARDRHRAAVEVTVRAIMVAYRKASRSAPQSQNIARPVAGKGPKRTLVVCEEPLRGATSLPCPGED